MKTWNGEKCKYAQIKRDGHMIRVVKDSKGKINYFTRNYLLKDLSFLPENKSIIDKVPNSTVLYCELWKPGEPSSYISSGIVNKDVRLHLDVFKIGNIECSLATLDVAKLMCDRWGLKYIPFFTSHETPLSIGTFNTVFELPKVLGGRFIEGYVLKNNNGDEGLKYVFIKTCDLRVIDIVLGKGKYTGLVGSLVCALENGRIIANVGKMTDKDRRDFTTNSPIGKIVEVKYRSVEQNGAGKLRFSSFVRIRDDKDYADETVS